MARVAAHIAGAKADMMKTPPSTFLWKTKRENTCQRKRVMDLLPQTPKFSRLVATYVQSFRPIALSWFFQDDCLAAIFEL
jgi:hypothetical protein